MKEELSLGLMRLRTLAGSGHEVTVQDILKSFAGVDLDEERIKAIYEYLDGEGIRVADYVPHDTNALNLGSDMEELYGDAAALDGEEQKVFDFYMDDLEAVPPLSNREEDELLKALASDDAGARRAAKNRLAEGSLRWVIQLARKQAGKGVPLSDLIQEGNMELLMALEEYDGARDWSDYAEKRIDGALKGLVKEQQGYAKAEGRIAAEANSILEAVKEMEEETGRAVSAEELSKRLGMSKTRVEEVLKESAKALKNLEQGL